MTATPSNIPIVTGTGRPTEYTPEEDQIILAYTSTKECQERLRAAGFSERTTAALVSRRKYLRDNGAMHVPVENLDATSEFELLTKRRTWLTHRLEDLHAQIGDVEEQVRAVNQRLHALLDQPIAHHDGDNVA